MNADDINELNWLARIYEFKPITCVGCGKKYYLLRRGECYCEECGMMLPDGEPYFKGDEDVKA